MKTFQQVHDFTPAGALRFKVFMVTHARPDVNVDLYRMDCLGVLEDNLNGSSTAIPLAWELGAFESATGVPATFSAVMADLIVETVDPTE
ncbi:hypothetical protein [Microvirgula aerodenitrificans]|mgnify:CR=1 FL=1|uniref:hypothetical protein n=1 Tax=Microvirgula aerodenitrificans TaxID=57480 RepID=UPI00248EACA7|nr:hypothetical protein [Microvirgula aerodenitrificans]